MKQQPSIDEEDEPKRAFCNCVETIVGEKRIRPPRWHSCEYIRQRNEHLLEVCAKADELVAKMPDTSKEQVTAKLSRRAQIISNKMDMVGWEVVRKIRLHEIAEAAEMEAKATAKAAREAAKLAKTEAATA